MRTIWTLILMILASVFPTQGQAQSICQIIAGAIIVAGDGKFLGKVSNKYDADSVLNEYGNYGNKYSSNSIWNEYGIYGGEYSNLSPFNQYTNSPPKLIKNGKAIAHLTVNRYLQAPLNPYFLKTCEFY